MSDARNRLVRNVLFSAVSWFSSLVFLLILVLAARYLGDVVYGRFTFAFAFVALFEVTTDVGLRDYLVREVARAREETGRFLVPKSFKLIFRSILVAHERFRREALVVNLERLVLLVACATALVLGADLVKFTAVFLGGSVFGLALTVLLTDRELRRPSRPERWGKSWGILRHSLPFGLSVAAFAVYFRLDSVILSLMRVDAEVGWYNAAYRLTEGLIVVPMVLQNAVVAIVPSAAAMALLAPSSMLPALAVATASYTGILLLLGFLDPSEREALPHLRRRLLRRMPGRGGSEPGS